MCDPASFKIYGFIFWAPEADTSWLRSLEQQVLDRLRKAQDLSTLSCFNTILCLEYIELPSIIDSWRFRSSFLMIFDPLVSSGKDAYLLSTLKRSMQKAVGSACTQGDAVDGSKIS